MIEYSTRQCKCGRGLLPKYWRQCSACLREMCDRYAAIREAKAAEFQMTYRRVRACRKCGEPMALNYADRKVKTCTECLTTKRAKIVYDCCYCGVPMPERSHNARMCDPCAEARRPWKQRAGTAVSAAIKAGALPKASEFACVDCGDTAEHWDHRDYAKPLDVQPVCRVCNFKRGGAAFPRPQPSEAAA